MTIPRTDLPEWRDRFGLVAGFTEKGGGPAPFSLGLRSNEPASAIMDRMRALREAMRPGFIAFHLAHQCHGTALAWHERAVPGFHLMDDVDGHATAASGALLMVSVADCVPVYLAADDGAAFALLHCGWRGTAAGMLERGIGALGDPARQVVHFGPAICGACYEVGPEVIKAVEGRDVPGKSLFDLRGALAARAEAAGLREISVSQLCTRHHNERFFSFRAGDEHGRQVAYLGRPSKRPNVGTSNL